MNSAFLASYQCLQKVYVDSAFSGIVLNDTLNSVNVKDKALITKIVYGVLDNAIRIDYILSKFTRKMKGEVANMLRIGVYCLENLSIPVYAVVNDLAQIAKLTGDVRQVGFVNATLKNVAKALEAKSIEMPTDEVERLSVEYSYPAWALSKLIKDYGIECAKEIISYNLSSDTFVRVNIGKIAITDFVALLEENNTQYTATMLDDCFAVKGRLAIDSSLYTVMSLSSMMVARSVATSGKCKVLDTCSAPGGKAVYIKQLNNDAEITACDLHQHRVELISSYANRMGVEIDAVCCDSTELNEQWVGNFDYVLCDVPCSGFGVVNSRPDIKLFRQNIDISNLMKLQKAILDNASNYVKVGGELIYSTCTVFKNENQQMVDKFLRNHSEFSLAPLDMPYFNGQCSYQFLPHVDNTQGFFVAKLIRNK